MRKMLIGCVLLLMGVLATPASTQAAANDQAPCIAENASTFAPALHGIGQPIVAPEARAGQTGTVASTNARTSCD
jgi:hypothetical protein